jgi:5-methylcytosine-specific restriction endonuclease McrA
MLVEPATRGDVEQAVMQCSIRPLARLLLLLLVLLTEAGNGTSAIPSRLTPSLATLASGSGLAKSAVAEYLRYLEGLAWIERVQPARTSRYARTTYSVFIGQDDPDWSSAVRGPRPSIPGALRRRVMDRDGHRCVICRAVADLTLDHLVPWSRGGEDTEENLRVLCRPCNARKGTRTGEQG